MDRPSSRNARRASSHCSASASIAALTPSSAATTRRRASGSPRQTITWRRCPPSVSRRWRDSSMSSSIWTRCAGDSELRALRLTPWRVVEAQHQLATRKLVDSAEEQVVLEDIIEASEPPTGGHARLHYLL